MVVYFVSEKRHLWEGTDVAGLVIKWLFVTEGLSQ